MNFRELLPQSKAGDPEAQDRMIRLYDPLLSSMAWHDGIFDEDL